MKHSDGFILAGHYVRGPISRAGWSVKSVRLGEHDFRTSPDHEFVSDDFGM